MPDIRISVSFSLSVDIGALTERSQQESRTIKITLFAAVCLALVLAILIWISDGMKSGGEDAHALEYVGSVLYLSVIFGLFSIIPLLIWHTIRRYLNPIEYLLSCDKCKIARPTENFVSGYELIGTAQSTKQVTSMMPAFGTTLGDGSPNIGFGAYASSSQVPIQLGRFNAIVLCPSPHCDNEGRYSFDTEVRIWNDVNGVESHEIVGNVKIPAIGLNN